MNSGYGLQVKTRRSNGYQYSSPCFISGEGIFDETGYGSPEKKKPQTFQCIIYIQASIFSLQNCNFGITVSPFCHELHKTPFVSQTLICLIRIIEKLPSRSSISNCCTTTKASFWSKVSHSELIPVHNYLMGFSSGGVIWLVAFKKFPTWISI